MVACGVFVIQMQHPDDNNMAWLPKLIVLAGLCAKAAGSVSACVSMPTATSVSMNVSVFLSGHVCVCLFPAFYFFSVSVSLSLSVSFCLHDYSHFLHKVRGS